MRFVIFSDSNFYFQPVISRLLAEGADVLSVKLSPEQAEPEDAQRYKSDKMTMLAQHLMSRQGSGIIPANLVVPYSDNLTLDTQNDLIIFDFNFGWQAGEKLKKQGFQGFMPEQIDYRLERERKLAYQFVRKYYGNVIDIIPFQDFAKGSVQDALKFIEQASEVYCFKPCSEALFSFVPQSEDTDIARQELVHFITANEDEIAKAEFQLQVRLAKMKEFTVETWYVNGTPLLASVDLEEKKLYNNATPTQSGCAGDLVYPIGLEHPLRLFNKPYDAIAKKRNFSGVMDISVLYNEEDNKFYFGEFCSSRFGYNALFTLLCQLAMPLGKFFESILSGQKEAWFSENSQGVSLRVFNTKTYQRQLQFVFTKKEPMTELAMPQLPPEYAWLWEVYKENDSLYLTNADENVLVLTNTVKENIEEAFGQLTDWYKNNLFFDGKLARTDVGKLLMERKQWIDETLMYELINKTLANP